MQYGHKYKDSFHQVNQQRDKNKSQTNNEKEQVTQKYNENVLSIEVKLSQTLTVNLAMSQNNYRQQFSQFVHDYNIPKPLAKIIKQRITEGLKSLAQQIHSAQSYNQEVFEEYSFEQVRKKTNYVDQIHNEEDRQQSSEVKTYDGNNWFNGQYEYSQSDGIKELHVLDHQEDYSKNVNTQSKQPQSTNYTLANQYHPAHHIYQSKPFVHTVQHNLTNYQSHQAVSDQIEAPVLIPDENCIPDLFQSHESTINEPSLIQSLDQDKFHQHRDQEIIFVGNEEMNQIICEDSQEYNQSLRNQKLQQSKKLKQEKQPNQQHQQVDDALEDKSSFFRLNQNYHSPKTQPVKQIKSKNNKNFIKLNMQQKISTKKLSPKKLFPQREVPTINRSENHNFQKYSSSKAVNKSPTRQYSNSKQKAINQAIFHRLYNQQTASYKQRQNPAQHRITKEIQDERVVFQAIQQKRQKYFNLSQQQRFQTFERLYNTSTESSLNRANLSKQKNSSSSYQIQQIIEMSNKKNNYNASTAKPKPNLSHKVYNPNIQKRCNTHCQQFQYEKKINQEKQRILKRQEQIKKQIRSRSKQSLSLGKSKQKKLGQCHCCHKQKIQSQRRKRLQRQRQKQRSYTSSTAYSIEKKLVPHHVSFITDVLQQSYQQLFPDK